MHVHDWQTWAAPAVVALTLAVFAFRGLRARKKGAGGCGGGCHCTVKDKLAPPSQRR